MAALSWREIRLADLPAALTIQPASLGHEIVGPVKAWEVWPGLFQNPSFHGIVIESDPPIAGHRIVAAGARVFVSPDLMSSEIADPHPGLNSRVIASLAQGESVLLPYSRIGSANAGAGIDLVSLICSWIEGLSESEIAEINGLLASSFL